MFKELCSPWTGWPSLEGPLCLWHTWHCHIWFLGGNPRNGCYPKNSLAFGSFNILILPSLSFPLSTTSWHVDLVNGAGSPCKLGLPVIWSLLLVQVGQARRPTGPHPARHYTTHPWLHTPATMVAATSHQAAHLEHNQGSTESWHSHPSHPHLAVFLFLLIWWLIWWP